MSCYGCSTKFGLFTKEHGCPSCGFAYCSKCLKFKAVIPAVGPPEKKICKSCYSKIMDPQEGNSLTNKTPLPPTAYLKRLELLETSSKPPIVVYQQSEKWEKLKAGLASKDLQLVERLQRLQEVRKEDIVPPDIEIARRLAILKNENPESCDHKPEYFGPDSRTDDEKTNALIKQLLEEQIIASKCNKPDEEIAARLARLRDRNPASSRNEHQVEPKNNVLHKDESMDIDISSQLSEMSVMDINAAIEDIEKMSKAGQTNQSLEKEIVDYLKKLKLEGKEKLGRDQSKETFSPDENVEEESEVDQVVSKALTEAKLNEENPLKDELEEELEDSIPQGLDELPWCIICNEEATVRCWGCDGDLYCAGCFQEGHQDEDMADHQTMLFKKSHKTK